MLCSNLALGSYSFQMPATMLSWFSLVDQSLDDLMMLFLTYCFHADVSQWHIYRRHCWCCKVFQVCTVWYFSLFNVEGFFFLPLFPFDADYIFLEDGVKISYPSYLKLDMLLEEQTHGVLYENIFVLFAVRFSFRFIET